MLCLSVQLSRQHPTDRHAVRHQGDHAKGLRSVGAGARLFRQFRSVRRFRSDLRRGETESQNHRDTDPLQGAHLRRDPDLAVSRRLAAVEDGVVRLSQIEGDLRVWPERRRLSSLEPTGRANARPMTWLREAIQTWDTGAMDFFVDLLFPTVRRT